LSSTSQSCILAAIFKLRQPEVTFQLSSDRKYEKCCTFYLIWVLTIISYIWLTVTPAFEDHLRKTEISVTIKSSRGYLIPVHFPPAT
jgi:hypothetical protein